MVKLVTMIFKYVRNSCIVESYVLFNAICNSFLREIAFQFHLWLFGWYSSINHSTHYKHLQSNHSSMIIVEMQLILFIRAHIFDFILTLTGYWNNTIVIIIYKWIYKLKRRRGATWDVHVMTHTWCKCGWA